MFYVNGNSYIIHCKLHKNEHTTDLSRITIDDMQLNAKIDKDKFIEDDEILFKNTIYTLNIINLI